MKEPTSKHFICNDVASEVRQLAAELRAAFLEAKQTLARSSAPPDSVESQPSGIDTYEDAIAVLRAVARIPKGGGEIVVGGWPETSLGALSAGLWSLAYRRATALAHDEKRLHDDTSHAMMCKPAGSGRNQNRGRKSASRAVAAAERIIRESPSEG